MVADVGDWNLLAHQNSISAPDSSPWRCHRSYSGSIAVKRVGEVGRTAFDGFYLCGSNACWYCSRSHSRKHETRWRDVMSKAIADGKCLAHMVLTIRTVHRRSSSSNIEARDVLYKGFSKFFESGWRRSRGCPDYMRAVETNMDLAPSGGVPKAHIHFNVVVVCEAGVDIEDLEVQFKRRWRKIISKLSPRHTPSIEHGVTLQRVQDTREDIAKVARYDTKLGSGNDVARECLDGGAKTGKGYTPEQLLVMSYHGDLEARRAYREWQKLLHGKRRFAMSQGLESGLDEALKDKGVDPATLETRLEEQEESVVCVVRGKTRGLLRRIGGWQSIVWKFGEFRCAELDRWLRILVDHHGSGELTDAEFLLNFRLWLKRAPPLPLI